jgi:hypothetical protein
MNIGQLVTADIPQGRSRKASSWRAFQGADAREIYHYSTLMATVVGETLMLVSNGWGSMTDKCGTRKMVNEATKAGFTVEDNR